MSRAAKALSGSRLQSNRALCAYLHDLVAKSSAKGAGASARERRKHAHIHLKDPVELGQFRVAIEGPGFRKMFAGVLTNSDGVVDMTASLIQ
jgi:hypothetical protein